MEEDRPIDQTSGVIDVDVPLERSIRVDETHESLCFGLAFFNQLWHRPASELAVEMDYTSYRQTGAFIQQGETCPAVEQTKPFPASPGYVRESLL